VIVTCGEALVDLVPETIDGDTLFRPVPGGSLYNVAIGVARLGGRAGYVWELSADSLGRNLREALDREGVDVTAVRTGDRATPVAVVDLTGEEARYSIADPGGVMHDTPLPALPRAAQCLVVGSAVLAREPVGSAIEALAATAPLLAIDYNVRPPAIVDLAAYKARLVRLSAAGGLVKASLADLDHLGERDAEGFMAGLAREGAALSVLTLGQGGAAAWTRAGAARVPAAAAAVVDTVGAGDAFMAGLLARLQGEGRLCASAMRGLGSDELAELLRHAQAVAAVTCGRRGAVMPAPREQEKVAIQWRSTTQAVG
jgi:fructokinase